MPNQVLSLAGDLQLSLQETASGISLLGLSDLILDIVQTGATLEAHGLVELAVVREIAPCLVVHRAAWQTLRAELGGLIARLEGAGVAA